MAHSIRFTQILTRTNQLAGDLQGLHFSSFNLPLGAWRPAVNVYAYEDRFEVCVDLAGVPKQEIEVHAEEHRLVVRGHRKSPEPGCANPPCGRVLIMEIAEGGFERVVEFPAAIDPDRTKARQENGWLWVTLPMIQTPE